MEFTTGLGLGIVALFYIIHVLLFKVCRKFVDPAKEFRDLPLPLLFHLPISIVAGLLTLSILWLLNIVLS